MPHKDIVVIGGSAGALPVLRAIVCSLPADIPASLFVVLHLSPDSPSLLAEILDRERGPRAKAPVDGESIEASTVYVAPPDRHLILQDGVMRVTRGPRENRSRPAIDPLFRSAAREYGERVIAVLLSGLLDDGVAGLRAVSRAGGTVLVLDPNDTRFPQMPKNAIRYDHPDYILGCDEIGKTIQQLVSNSSSEQSMSSQKESREKESPRAENRTPSGYVCPDCGGTLFEDHSQHLPHFTCRVGHAYSLNALLSAEDGALETALWAAVRSLEENAALKRRAAESLGNKGRPAAGLLEDAEHLAAQAKLLQERILKSNGDKSNS